MRYIILGKKDEQKIMLYHLKKTGKTKQAEVLKNKINNTKKEVKLELLVEELRKTVCILGSIIQIQNADLKDENIKQALNDKLNELSQMRSMGKLKKYFE